MKKNKRIRYRHIHALRDLSNCFNFKGIKIKKGLLLRSGYLGKLSALQAKQFVEKFNIGYVIDLRTNAEVENAPDMYSNLVEYYHIPVVKEFDNPLVTKENRNSILLDISKNKGGAVKYLSNVYRKMVTDEYCLSQFKKIFDLLLNKKDNKAVIFHCTQGKDRTGVLAALILYALGVDRRSICNDYIRFNNAYRIKNFIISCIVAIRFMSFRVSKDLYYLQMAHKKLIKATFDEIYKPGRDRYSFLNDYLGLDKEKVDLLREKYLVEENK
ncbi:MAG: tyrosine-protein phosphatase [Firmicutes bacterium]|nr:tyrosine-protein phosphatase [Candidatus Fiminaster equi]